MNRKIKKAFNDIQADENLKQKTFDKIVSTKKKRTTPLIYKSASLVAVLAFMILGGIYVTPTSYISIDINPSIELAVNRFNRVIDVTASNQDADEIVDSVDLKNEIYTDALEMLEHSEAFKTNIGAYTEITVLANNDKNADIMIANINACSMGMGGNVKCFSVNSEIKEEAEKLDISFGKYRAFLELQALNPTITIDEVKGLSMRVLREMIDSNEPVDQFPSGNGHGHGKKNRNRNS